MAQPLPELKPLWSSPSHKDKNRAALETMIDGPYEIYTLDGLNSLTYEKFKTYVHDENGRIDYERERVSLRSHLIDPGRKGTGAKIPVHGDISPTIFEIRRSFLPTGEKVTIHMSCISEDPGSIWTFTDAIYDENGVLNDGGSFSSDPRFKYEAAIAGHIKESQLLPRIDMRATIEGFMRQVNGQNEREALDFSAPTLVPYREPGYKPIS